MVGYFVWLEKFKLYVISKKMQTESECAIRIDAAGMCFRSNEIGTTSPCNLRAIGSYSM